GEFQGIFSLLYPGCVGLGECYFNKKSSPEDSRVDCEQLLPVFLFPLHCAMAASIFTWKMSLVSFHPFITIFAPVLLAAPAVMTIFYDILTTVMSILMGYNCAYHFVNLSPIT
ncbi:MAG: hypothetical protein MUO62_14390, partial [Anaerolineales bacterium]|nr:hypothetical protein [Anaerolineales bacterium]